MCRTTCAAGMFTIPIFMVRSARVKDTASGSTYLSIGGILAMSREEVHIRGAAVSAKIRQWSDGLQAAACLRELGEAHE